jgi:hypothetical protein
MREKQCLGVQSGRTLSENPETTMRLPNRKRTDGNTVLPAARYRGVTGLWPVAPHPAYHIPHPARPADG